MASDIKLVGDTAIIEGSVGIGTKSPQTLLHVENAEIHSGGTVGGFSFGDRTQPGGRWVWYAQDGKARLWSGSDKIVVDQSGGIDAPQASIGVCFVKASLRGGFLGRSQLFIASRSVVVKDPALKADTGLGVALAHTDKDELLLNENGGYKGGVRISGKVTVDGNVQVNGVLTQSSSREVKENITPFSAREAMRALGALNPVKFFYKDAEHKEQRVGFVAEESPGLVTAAGHKAVAVLDVVAVLTKVVQQQQEVISRLGDEMDELRRTCGRLLDATAGRA